MELDDLATFVPGLRLKSFRCAERVCRSRWLLDVTVCGSQEKPAAKAEFIDRGRGIAEAIPDTDLRWQDAFV